MNKTKPKLTLFQQQAINKTYELILKREQYKKTFKWDGYMWKRKKAKGEES